MKIELTIQSYKWFSNRSLENFGSPNENRTQNSIVWFSISSLDVKPGLKYVSPSVDRTRYDFQNVDVAQGRTYEVPREDRTYYLIVIALSRQAC